MSTYLRFPCSLSAPIVSGLVSLALLGFFSALIAACGDSDPQSHLERQALFHLTNLETSAVALGRSFEDIAKAKRLNTPERMQATAAIIEKTRGLLAEADNEVEIYTNFISDHKKLLAVKKLDSYILIRDLLNRHLVNKRSAMADCLSTMENWLEFAACHFAKIEAGDKRSRRNYDALFFRLSKSFARYEAVSKAYRLSVRHFLSRHPGIKEEFKTQYRTLKEELDWP